MNKSAHKRRIKLIKPRLQLKLIGTFMGLSGLSFLLQVLVLGRRLSEMSVLLPNDGAYLHSLTPTLLNDVLLFSFGLLLPLTFTVGVLVTFRIAGPIYRFESHLAAVERGESVPPCKIRRGDELKDLCDQINRTLDAVGVETTAPAQTVDEKPAPAVAA